MPQHRNNVLECLKRLVLAEAFRLRRRDLQDDDFFVWPPLDISYFYCRLISQEDCELIQD